jgi:hypothetical protein
VLDQIERSLRSAPPPSTPLKITAVGFAELILLAVTVIGIILLVRWAF